MPVNLSSRRDGRSRIKTPMRTKHVGIGIGRGRGLRIRKCDRFGHLLKLVQLIKDALKAPRVCEWHGMSKSPEYAAFTGAFQRCTDSRHPRWLRYGGRGIEFRFASFAEFFTELGPRPLGKTSTGKSLYSLDRYPNPDGHYEKGNVRWATSSEQERNKSI